MVLDSTSSIGTMAGQPIEVNERYELIYRISVGKLPDYDYNRKHSIVLLEKTEPKKVIIRLDNSHSKKTGKWPTHIHLTKKRRHYFLGGSWNSVKQGFLEEATKLIGEENRQDLVKALVQCGTDQHSGELVEQVGVSDSVEIRVIRHSKKG